jgi:hypothetical protein
MDETASEAMKLDVSAQRSVRAFRVALAAASGLAAVAAGATGGLGQPAPGPSEKEAPAKDEELEHPGALEGTETREWWLHPNFAFRLQNEGALDRGMVEWPENLVEGVGTTSGQAVLERRFGPLTLQAGAGLGMATTRAAAGTVSDPRSPRTSVVTPVVSAGLELELPGRWYLRAGATASQTSWSVGVQAGTEF